MTAVLNERRAAFRDSTTEASDERVGLMLLVSSLEHGGAERQVVELMRRIDRRRFRPLVCSLSEHVPLAERLPRGREDIVIVRKRWKYDWTTVARVAAILRERRIDVVHAFLFDAEMAARLAARRAGVPAVIASERNADYARPLSHRLGLWLTRERFDVMIANSEAGRRFNLRTQRLDGRRIVVVRNGVDTDYFAPRDTAALRAELGIPAGAPVIGMVAAFKRQKRHADFFALAQCVARRFPAARFLCVGEPLRDNHQGAGDYHDEMRRRIAALDLSDRFSFLGRRSDMPEIYSLCDATVLPSEHEGVPNVLLESMACGVPPVATDVADNAFVVRDRETGFITRVGDVESQVSRVCRLIEDAELRRGMGAAGRRWVQTEFSVETMVRRTEAVYLDVLDRKRGADRRAVPSL